MDVSRKAIFLDCALSRYLEEVASRAGGAEAAFSAAMLADMGYFDKYASQADIDNLHRLLQMLAEGRHTQVMSEFTGHCQGCDKHAGCPVGGLILARHN